LTSGRRHQSGLARVTANAPSHHGRIALPTPSKWANQDKVITKMKKNKTISPSMIHTTRVLVLERPDLTTRMPRGFDASA
jgi:hypothetical protein